MIQIYGLKDPVTFEIRYIGMTSKTLKQRLRKHLDNALYAKHNLHLCNWILKYYKSGKILPIIELIEECDESNWIEREKYWIKFYRNKIGKDLLNYSEGGEGSFGFKHSEKSKEKIRNLKLGNKQSLETRVKRSESLKGRIITKSHRAKIGRSNSGKIYTKYKVLVVDETSGIENIFLTTKLVSEFLKCGRMTVYRYIESGKLFKNKYKISKINL